MRNSVPLFCGEANCIIKSNKQLNLIIGVICTTLSLTFMMLSGWLYCVGASTVVSWDLYRKALFKIEFRLIFDHLSLGFSSAVLFITGAVFTFSKFYMATDAFFLRFHLLVFSFVISMLTLIFGVRIISLILGWDGLGMTSYLLVIYYSSWKRANAGILTALMNRVGDVFILIRIALTLIEGGYNFNITIIHKSSLMGCLVTLVFFAGITKRAQLPFSAWLPAAMAAPTPVSSLVHSSTLVTAGVYLLIRHQSRIEINKLASLLILLIGTRTIIMAGMSGIVEIDIKKIVALSTLRHLGLIFSSVGLNQWVISFFHIITHAFSKALLFLRVGNIIHSRNEYQDLRRSKVTSTALPISSSLVISTNLRLCGMPFFAGFYSKDAWLEIILIGEYPLFIYFIFILGVIVSCLYSARLLFFILVRNQESIVSSLQSDEDSYFKISVLPLWYFSLFSGSMLSWTNFTTPEIRYIPLDLKLITIKIITLRICLYWLVGCKSLHWGKNRTSWVDYNMWGLPLIRFEWIKISRMVEINKAFLFTEKPDNFFFQAIGTRGQIGLREAGPGTHKFINIFSLTIFFLTLIIF